MSDRQAVDVPLGGAVRGKAPPPQAAPSEADVPPFVVAGEWRDPEWQALAGKLTSALTGAELRRVIDGPRRHPYAAGAAYQTIKDGQVIIWPSAAAAKLYEATSV